MYVKLCNILVNRISTFAKVESNTTVLQFVCKNKIIFEVQCPTMRSVDLAEQLIRLYKIPIKSKKYCFILLFNITDMVVLNARLFYRQDASRLKLQKNDILPLADFKLSIDFEFEGWKDLYKKRGRPSSAGESSKPKKNRWHHPLLFQFKQTKLNTWQRLLRSQTHAKKKRAGEEVIFTMTLAR